MRNEAEEYLLGSSDPEIARLAFQHAVWASEARELWVRAGIGEGDSVADLGCGPGFASAELSHLVGNEGCVYAVDSSKRFVAVLEERIREEEIGNVVIRRGDVTGTGLPDDAVDFVFARWLFCFLPSPGTALKEAFRIIRPGGSFLIIDYFNYLAADIFPRRKVLSRLFDSYLLTVEDAGGSYDIGDRLPALLKDAGFDVVSLSPVCRIAEPGSPYWRWVESFNELAVPGLVDKGIWSENDAAAFRDEWQEAAEDPGTFFFTPPMISIVAEKPGR